MITYNASINNNFSFKGVSLRWRKRPEQISVEDFKKITSLVEKYNKTHDFAIKMNGTYLAEFRKLCTTLVAGINAGLIFTNIFNDSSRIQVAKRNTNKDELLTFSYLDEENKPLRRYRIGKDGYIYSPSAEIKKQPPFDFNIVSILHAEIDKLNNILDNYNYLKKVKRKAGEQASFLNLAEEVQPGKLNLKTEIDTLINTSCTIHSKFSRRKNSAFHLKQEFFDETNPKSKSYTLKNVGPNNETYSFSPSRLSKDGRNSMVQVFDKNNNLNCIYILYDNGDVKSVIDYSKPLIELRSNNLKYVAKSSAEEKKVKNIITLFISKLNDFNDFIDFKITCRKNPVSKTQTIIQKGIQQIVIAPEKAENTKTKSTAQKKAKRHTSAPISKDITTQTRVITPSISNNTDIKPYVEQTKSIEELKKDFLNTNYADVVLLLKTIFSTPIEKRSSHLIHEKLPDGRIFGGRFSINSQDGSTITVSQKKSNNFWNFFYYSIKIKRGDSQCVLNIDPENGNFISSTKEGKLIINSDDTISHMPKKTLLARNPVVIKLPQYINEICIFDNTQEKQIVEFSNTGKNNALYLKQKEKEVEETLKQLENEEVKEDIL